MNIWDAKTGKAMSGPLKEKSGLVTMLAYSSDGTRIISYSKFDGTLCLFDARTATVALKSPPGHTENISSIDISPDGKYIVSGSSDMTLCVWDVVDGKLIHGPLTGHTNQVHFVRYSPDGHRVLSCSWDRTLLQWDARTGDSIPVDRQIVDTFPPLNNYGRQRFVSAAYSPDGGSIATISHGASVWDSITGGMIVGPIGGETRGKSAEFSADGMTLFTGWDDGAVQIWDVKRGQLVSIIQPTGHSSVLIFAFSPDRLYNAVFESGYPHQTMYQRSTLTGEQARGSFEGHTGNITSIQFSSDGTRVVSGAADQTVHIWDAKTGTSIFGPLEGHTSWVQSVAYSPDGMYVASASLDKTIRIWDASTQPNPSPLVEWILNEDGWVMNGQSQRLIWVPLDLRGSLMSPRNIMLLSRGGYVRLSFDGAMFGEAWADCWLGG